jgi:hypothetical protein
VTWPPGKFALMTCRYVNSLERECGRPVGNHGMCDFHAVLDAFEGQWALDDVVLPRCRPDVAIRVLVALTQQAVKA